MTGGIFLLVSFSLLSAVKGSSNSDDSDDSKPKPSGDFECWQGAQIGEGNKFIRSNFKPKKCKFHVCTQEWIPGNGKEYPEQLILDCVEYANDNWKNEIRDFGSRYRSTKKTKCIEGNMETRVWLNPPTYGQSLHKGRKKNPWKTVKTERCICPTERCNAKELTSGVEDPFASRIAIAVFIILTQA